MFFNGYGKLTFDFLV